MDLISASTLTMILNVTTVLGLFISVLIVLYKGTHAVLAIVLAVLFLTTTVLHESIPRLNSARKSALLRQQNEQSTSRI